MPDALSYSYLPKSTLPDDISQGMKELFAANQYLEQKKAMDIDNTKRAMSVSSLAWNQDQKDINERVNNFQVKYADALKKTGAYTISKLPLEIQQQLESEKNQIEYDAKKSIEQKKIYDDSIKFLNEHADKFDVAKSSENLTEGYVNKNINERQAGIFFVPKKEYKGIVEILDDLIKNAYSYEQTYTTTPKYNKELDSYEYYDIEEKGRIKSQQFDTLISNLKQNDELFAQAKRAQIIDANGDKTKLEIPLEKWVIDNYKDMFVKPTISRKIRFKDLSELSSEDIRKNVKTNIGVGTNEQLIDGKLVKLAETRTGIVRYTDKKGEPLPTIRFENPLNLIKSATNLSDEAKNQIIKKWDANIGANVTFGNYETHIEPIYERKTGKNYIKRELLANMNIDNPEYIKQLAKYNENTSENAAPTAPEKITIAVKSPITENIRFGIQSVTGKSPEEQIQDENAAYKKRFGKDVSEVKSTNKKTETWAEKQKRLKK